METVGCCENRVQRAVSKSMTVHMTPNTVSPLEITLLVFPVAIFNAAQPVLVTLETVSAICWHLTSL